MIIKNHIQNSIGRIQLNSATSLNALTLEMGEQISTTLQTWDANANLKVVIIESHVQKAFSVGIDLKEFTVNNSPEYRESFLKTWNNIATFSKPIIASINGYAFGGGLELALMADIRIASETAVFSQPELSVGTIPGIGATQRLPRIIGTSKATDMILTGRRIDAHTALQWGLVSDVVPHDHIAQATNDMAKLIAAKSLPLLIHAKSALRLAAELPLTQGITHEQNLFLSTFELWDQQEGFHAFLQKRPPVFKDC
jgi:enoyl-CoA hydratase/carnithine racemase